MLSLISSSAKNAAGRTRAGFSLHPHPTKFRPPLAGCAAEDVPPSALSPEFVQTFALSNSMEPA